MKTIILEGTDAVGKSSTAAALAKRGIMCEDRSKDIISRYMLFDVDMSVRAAHYDAFLRNADVLVVFLVNHDEQELMRRIYSRPTVSEFDKRANEYNRLYQDTFEYMVAHKLTHGKLVLLDCTGLSLDEQIDAVEHTVRSAL